MRGRNSFGAAPGAAPRPRVRMTQEQMMMQAAEQDRLRRQALGAVEMPMAGPTPVPPGALTQYYGDLSSGVLAPEDMRMESLQYRVQIDPSGAINSESQSVMLVSRYNFAIRRIIGFTMDPAFVGAAPALVDFNIQEDGRNFTIFKTDVSMAALSNGSSCNVAEWDGVYITVPGTQLSVIWSVDQQRWPALVGATKEIGIQIIGDLVVCRGDGWGG